MSKFDIPQNSHPRKLEFFTHGKFHCSDKSIQCKEFGNTSSSHIQIHRYLMLLFLTREKAQILLKLNYCATQPQTFPTLQMAMKPNNYQNGSKSNASTAANRSGVERGLAERPSANAVKLNSGKPKRARATPSKNPKRDRFFSAGGRFSSDSSNNFHCCCSYKPCR